MPNWCEVEVEIVFGDKKEYDKFIDQAGVSETTDHYLTNHEEKLFEKFVPTPAAMLNSEGWYMWRIENWGTKWNPEIHGFDTDDESQTVFLSINTAWAPPTDFFQSFYELFPSTEIEIKYLEEGMMYLGRLYISEAGTEDICINQIPDEALKELGYVFDKKGNIDHGKSEDTGSLWHLVADDKMFYKYADTNGELV